MYHRKKGRKLGRKTEHRQALLNNLVTALFDKEKIKTTVPKSKELRRIAEKLITMAKRNDLHSRRLVARRIHDRKIVKKLFTEIAPRYLDRNGGYTRIIKLGPRFGDAAEMSYIELV